eukprot:TRINITY_DN16993_c0_g1_i1.p1 TRINITY_DN16993_c0_g1~~TRINITY_DN16993_c0_g1_i1.p1  ORF type:complete len:564 (+),score=91.21 TRINITY_DN16993_c0_g1_i1:67-1758(+)
MEAQNPFQAYVTVRQQTSTYGRTGPFNSTSLSSVSQAPSSPGPINSDRLEAPSALSLDLEKEAFSAYLSLRPPKSDGPPEPLQPAELTVEQHLRQEVLKTKKQLLDVALEMELKASSPGVSERAVRELRRLQKAQKYLIHPERTLEVFSGSEGEEEEFEDQVALRQPKKQRRKKPEPLVDTTEFGPDRRWSSGSVHRIPPDLLQSDATKGVSQTWGGQWSPKGRSLMGSWKDDSSLPSGLNASMLHAGRKQEVTLLPRKDSRLTMSSPTLAKSSSLPRIEAGTSQHLAKTSSKAADKHEEEATVNSWWSKSRSWNVLIANKDLTASRRVLECGGGAVVLGDGVIPIFSGSHLLSTGYYYAFQIESIDDENFPLDGLRDFSFAFGISHLPANDKRCAKPIYGYEIPGSIFVGYGPHIVDMGEWYTQQTWDPKELKQGDVVGVLISPRGDLVVFVNGAQVLRVATSLSRADKEKGNSRRRAVGPRRTIYPIIDLHGRVSAVTLLPRSSIPNVNLTARNRTMEKDVNPLGEKGRRKTLPVPGRFIPGIGRAPPEKEPERWEAGTCF